MCIRDRQQPGARFLLPCASAEIETQVREALSKREFAALPMIPVDGQAREALRASDAALIKSGTSTLEAMLLGVPMVVAYRLPAVTYQIVKRLLRTNFVALPNILAAEELVPELLQHDMQPAKLALALRAQLSDRQLLAAPLNSAASASIKARFAAIHQSLRCNASVNAAGEVLRLVRSRA